jgi:hypothetical protein
MVKLDSYTVQVVADLRSWELGLSDLVRSPQRGILVDRGDCSERIGEDQFLSPPKLQNGPPDRGLL